MILRFMGLPMEFFRVESAPKLCSAFAEGQVDALSKFSNLYVRMVQKGEE
jgi:hypothetical protein